MPGMLLEVQKLAGSQVSMMDVIYSLSKADVPVQRVSKDEAKTSVFAKETS